MSRVTTRPSDPTGDPGPMAAAGIPLTEALGTAVDAARRAEPKHEGPDGRAWLTLPSDYKLTEVPDESRIPVLPRARVELDERESLIVYVNRFQSPATVLIADYDALEIAARLDWHPANDADTYGKAGADRHVAALRLRPSEEFQRWDKMEGEFHKQALFAAFLEENAVDICHPEATTMIEISRDLEATIGHNFKSSTRLENGDRKFVFESDTRVANDVIVPKEFCLSIPIYQGEEPETLRCAFRYRPTGDGLMMGFEWRRVEYQRQAHFAAIANAVAEATGRPAVFGRLK